MTKKALLLTGANTIQIDLARTLLEEAGIPFVLEGPDFDVAELGRGAHDMIRGQNLFVPAEQYERARELLDSAWEGGEEELTSMDFSSAPPPWTEPVKTPPSMLTALLALTTMLFGFLWLRSSSELVHAQRPDPNFAYEFTENRRIARWSDTGERAMEVTYDADGTAVQQVYRDRNGVEVQVLYDEDSDGIIEKSVWFHATGEPTHTALDEDADGRPDRLLEHRPSGLLIESTDEDGDGFFERRVLYDAEGEPIRVELDRELEGWVRVS